MPTYEYECPRCGVFEVEQRITAPAHASCPVVRPDVAHVKGDKPCGEPVKRLVGSAGFALKGGTSRYQAPSKDAYLYPGPAYTKSLAK